ncbi:hypothetical protein QOT17_006593 [Balamuthia mandrillaris]
MALALWVAFKLTLKVGGALVGKVAAKGLLGFVGKGLSSNYLFFATRLVGRVGLEKFITKLGGNSKLFFGAGPFANSEFSTEEIIRATLDVELAESEGPGGRRRFARLRALSPYIRYRTKQNMEEQLQEEWKETTITTVLAKKKKKLDLRTKFWRLFQPMPVFPHLLSCFPGANEALLFDYVFTSDPTLVLAQSYASGKQTLWRSFVVQPLMRAQHNTLRRIKYYRWKKALTKLEAMENWEYLWFLEELGNLQTFHEMVLRRRQAAARKATAPESAAASTKERST